MSPESTSLPYLVLVNIARLVNAWQTEEVVAIPSIAEEVRSKYPLAEMSDRDLEKLIADFVEAARLCR